MKWRSLQFTRSVSEHTRHTGFETHWIALQSHRLHQFKIVLRFFFIFKTWHCLNANNWRNQSVQIERNKNPKHICALHKNFSYQQQQQQQVHMNAFVYYTQFRWIGWFLRIPFPSGARERESEEKEQNRSNKLWYVKSLKLLRCTWLRSIHVIKNVK